MTVLTNFDGADLQDMGIQRSVRDLVTARALLAAEVAVMVSSHREKSPRRFGPRWGRT